MLLHVDVELCRSLQAEESLESGFKVELKSFLWSQSPKFWLRDEP
jgi:hypothetical protein